MRTMRTVLPTILMPTILSAQAAGASHIGGPASDDEAAIRRVVDTYVETWNQHDMDAWGRLFTDDVDYVNRAGGWWQSNRENVAGHRAIHDAIARHDPGAGLEGRVSKIGFLTDGIAIVHVQTRATSAGRTAATPGTSADEWRPGAIMTLVMVKRGGRWLIRALQNTLVEPAPLPGAPPRGEAPR